MIKDTLENLISRIEENPPNDRRVDAAIEKDILRFLGKAPEKIVTSGYGWREDDAGWWLVTGEDARTAPQMIRPPRWLASLDAALEIIPSGWFLEKLFEMRTGTIYVGDTHNPTGKFQACLQHVLGGRLQICTAGSLPRALTGACLMARLSDWRMVNGW